MSSGDACMVTLSNISISILTTSQKVSSQELFLRLMLACHGSWQTIKTEAPASFSTGEWRDAHEGKKDSLWADLLKTFREM